MATIKVMDVKSVSSSDCRLVIEVDGEAKEFFARRVRYEGDMPAVGEFEPVRSFRDPSLDVHQFRELMRIVVAVHSSGSPGFPILLGVKSSA